LRRALSVFAATWTADSAASERVARLLSTSWQSQHLCHPRWIQPARIARVRRGSPQRAMMPSPCRRTRSRRSVKPRVCMLGAKPPTIGDEQVPLRGGIKPLDRTPEPEAARSPRRGQRPRQGMPSRESAEASDEHDGALKRKSSQELQAGLTQARSVDVRPDEQSTGTETRPERDALAIGCLP
jgi:hypothetical protein